MVSARRLGLAAAIAIAAGAGCQDLIGLTTGHEGPKSTGGTAGSGAGGTSSTGGQCEDCVSDDCRTATCVDGKCVFEFEPATKLLPDATPGDCLSNACDGAGNIVSGVPDDTDVAKGECTWDACAGGLKGHLDRPEGTHCTGGVCQAGACVPAVCGAANQAEDPPETDVDCGGPCAPCVQPGMKCLVHDDCKSGFCASGHCSPRVALATTLKSGQLVYCSYSAAWACATDATMNMQMGAVGLGFDGAGEAVAVARHSTTEALSARWEAGVWKPVTQWPISGVGESASNTWVPAISATREALYLFVQNANSQHKVAAASKVGVNSFLPVEDAASPFSGGAATRQGHLSFFYPDGTTRLVERRFLGGVWSPPATVLTGNYADAQPATAALPGLGTLVVATRRDGIHHVLDWALLGDGVPAHQGTVADVKFLAPAPPPRRLALSARADGGAILAFKTPDGNLDAWIADADAGGNLVWTQKSQGINTIPLGPDPTVARGIEGPTGPKAELVWVQSGTSAMRHARLLQNGTWSAITDVIGGVGASVAIAVP